MPLFKKTRPVRHTAEESDEYVLTVKKVLPRRGGSSLVWVDFSEPPIALDGRLVSLFPLIIGAKTIPDHAEYIYQSHGLLYEKEDLINGLKLLKEKGVLRSKEKLLHPFLSIPPHSSNVLENPSQKPSAIEEICWVTCNNQTTIIESIKSYYNSFRDTDQSSPLPFSIFDDTKNENVCNLLESKLKQIADESEITVSYTGLKQKNAFMKGLQSAGTASHIPEAVIRFALSGHPHWTNSAGANRNCLFLATHGKTVLSNDYDCFSTFTRLTPKLLRIEDQEPPKPSEPELTLSSEFDPSNFRFFNNFEELSSSTPYSRDSLYDHHNKFLGKKAKDIIAAYSGNSKAIKLRGTSPNLIERLRQVDPTIRVTGTGIYGDSGMGNPLYILLSDGPERAQLTASLDDYLAALTKRTILYGVTTPHITESPYLLGAQIGLDNRDMLPPFMPVGRNQDSVFGYLLQHCYGPGAMAYLPIAVTHHSENHYAFKREDLYKIAPRICDIVMMILEANPVHSAVEAPPDRLHSIGESIKRVGEQPIERFREYLFHLWLDTVKKRIGYMESLLQKHRGEPHYWAEDVERVMEAFETYTLERNTIIPADYENPSNLTHEEYAAAAEDACREVIRMFGELLILWPDLLNLTVELKQSNISLEQPL